MTKQEEIREGIVRLGYDIHDVEEIFNYLHSQGVVIEVDEEPVKGYYYGKGAPQQLVLTEPLVEG